MSPQLSEPICSTMRALTRGLLTILGDRLVGVYLGGSAASEDFCEASSDLDFLVVTRGELNLEDEVAIKLLHKDVLRKHPYARRLEGDYVPREYLVPEGTTVPVPGCEHGLFLPKVGEIMLSADNIADMRQHGVTFHGPEPRAVLPAVSPDQVREAARTMLADGIGLCSTPAEAASELLNLLRSALAIEIGEPTTKSSGAKWGLAHLSPEFHPAIRAAVEIRCGAEEPDLADLVMATLPRLDQSLRLQFCPS